MTKEPLHKIMVIEDEEDILTIVKYSLEKLGHFEVEYFNSGKLALQKAESSMPDLILMDMMMPEMNGLTVLSNLRQNTKIAHIPVIFMTARAQPEEIKSYLKAGAIGVITKPFDPLTLPEKLREMWNGQNKES